MKAYRSGVRLTSALVGAERCSTPTEGRRTCLDLSLRTPRGDHSGRGYTHKDVHVAVALDGLGRRLGTLSVPTIPTGYENLVNWARGFGPLERAGVEGTGSFGAGLTRFLRAQGIEVFEVMRPKRRDQ